MALLIRPLRETDGPLFCAAFLAQGWHPRLETYERYLEEQRQGLREVLVAELCGRPVGYLTLRREAVSGPFAHQGIPELADFNVLQRYQHQGIGTALMDAAEAAAKRLSPVVSIGVGLHSGYGAAQRMYVRRGYLPDGSGVWQDGRPVVPYTTCRNDDDLILYFSKNLE